MTNDELLAVLREALADRDRDLAEAQQARDNLARAIVALEAVGTLSISPKPFEIPPSATPKPVGRANGANRPNPPTPKATVYDYAEITRVAVEAINDGRNVITALAEQFNVTRNNAQQLLFRARKAGHDIPTERLCQHCGRMFDIRGLTTHERSCLGRPLPVRPEPAVVPNPEPPSLAELIDTSARHIANEKAAGRKLADEIAELRARDRAEHDAKGRSAVTDNGDDEPVAHLWWTCADCQQRFDRKMELHRHTLDVHDRHSLYAREEIGAIA